MRNLAVLVAFLCGCGPAVGGDAPVDDDWMLGTFSNFSTLPVEGSRSSRTRFELLSDGVGEIQVIGSGCDVELRPMSWSLLDDGSVRLEYQSESDAEVSMVFSSPTCGNEGILSYAAERRLALFPDAPEEVYPTTLYRSSICPGVYVPGDDCLDKGNECDPRGHCTAVWCEGGEPERCDE